MSMMLLLEALICSWSGWMEETSCFFRLSTALLMNSKLQEEAESSSDGAGFQDPVLLRLHPTHLWFWWATS